MDLIKGKISLSNVYSHDLFQTLKLQYTKHIFSEQKLIVLTAVVHYVLI